MSSFINESFVPLSVHIKENPRNFHRFDAVWTPTVLVMDPDGKERSRLEGYLSTDEFRAFLEMGLARVAFMKKDWAEAERRYGRVSEFLICTRGRLLPGCQSLLGFARGRRASWRSIDLQGQISGQCLGDEIRSLVIALVSED